MNLKRIDAAIAAYKTKSEDADAARLAFFREVWGVQDSVAAEAAALSYEVPAAEDLLAWYAASEPVLAHAPVSIDPETLADAIERTAACLLDSGGFPATVQEAFARTKWDRMVAASDVARAGSDPAAYVESFGELLRDDGMDEDPARVGALAASLALRALLGGPAAQVGSALRKAGAAEPHPMRCPVCGGALMPLGTSLRCPQGHSYDMAKEGYVNLLAIQKRHAADPGDGKAMVRARRAFLQAGYYAPFQKALAELCLEYAPECGETHLLDAGCGEGSYDRVVYDAFAAQGRPCVLAGFDLSKDAIRLAAKLLPEAAFAVGGSFSAPVRDGWADVLLNIFSPFAEQEFCRVLRSGGVLLYAVPTARHLYGLKEVLYDEPYENAEQQTEYSGFTLIGERTVTDTITVEGDQIRNLFAMTPYFWKTPHVGALRLAAKQSLTTEIGFRFLAYRRV